MNVNNSDDNKPKSNISDDIRSTDVKRKTTLLRDYNLKITHIVMLADILSNLMVGNKSARVIDELVEAFKKVQTSIRTLYITDDLSSALLGYLNEVEPKLKSLALAFNEFVKFRETLNSDRQLTFWKQTLRTLEEQRSKLSSIIISYSTSSKKAGNPDLLKNITLNKYGLIINSLNKTLKELKTNVGDKMPEELETSIVEMQIRKATDIESSSFIIESLDEVISKIEEHVSKTTKQEKVLLDMFNVRSGTMRSFGTSDSSISNQTLVSTFTNLLQRQDLASMMQSYGIPNNMIVDIGVFRSLEVEDFMGTMQPHIENQASAILKQLQIINNRILDISSAQSVKEFNTTTFGNDIKRVISLFETIENISLNMDTRDVIKILKNFITESKNSMHVMDKLGVVYRNNNGVPTPSDTYSLSKDLGLGNLSTNPYNIGAMQLQPPQKGGGFMYRRIDINLLSHFVSQMASFSKEIDKKMDIVSFLSSSREILTEKLNKIERYFMDNANSTESNIVILRKNSQKLKLNAFKWYFDTIKHQLNRFTRLNTLFVTTRHRNAHEYMMYWSVRANANKDVKFINNECRSLIKKYFDIKSSFVTNINKSIFEEIIKDVASTMSLAKSKSQVQLDIAQENALVKMVDNLFIMIDKRGKIIMDLHIHGKSNLTEIVLSPAFIIVYVMKVVRLLSAWYALRVAGKYFQKMYDSQVYKYENDPPSLWNFIGIFILVDVIINALLLGTIFGINIFLSDSNGDTLIDGIVLKAITLDYVMVMTMVIIISGIIGYVIKNKKYFRYKYEGDRGIRAMQKMIMNVYFVIVLVPFFRLVIG